MCGWSSTRRIWPNVLTFCHTHTDSTHTHHVSGKEEAARGCAAHLQGILQPLLQGCAGHGRSRCVEGEEMREREKENNKKREKNKA
jgi:hypothetical protein